MTASNHPALFYYPERTVFGRVVPKNRIVAASSPTRRVRDQLTTQVAKIVWQNKLASETLNLKGSKSVPEIQVFTLVLKPEGMTGELSVDILRCIDRAIGFPIIFELTTRREDGAVSDQVRVAATYKRPSEADASKWVIDEYFATGWLPSDTPRSPLPVALDLPRLYEQIFRQLIPVSPQSGESIKNLVERQNRIATKQREYQRLETRIHREKQIPKSA